LAPWLGVVTPCSGRPARSPGRNWSTASGASLAPVSGPVQAVPAAALPSRAAATPPSSTARSARGGFAGSYALVRSYLDAYRVRPDPAAPPHPRCGRSPVGSPATPPP
jgi:hypothetical protein